LLVVSFKPRYIELPLENSLLTLLGWFTDCGHMLGNFERLAQKFYSFHHVGKFLFAVLKQSFKTSEKLPYSVA